MAKGSATRKAPTALRINATQAKYIGEIHAMLADISAVLTGGAFPPPLTAPVATAALKMYRDHIAEKHSLLVGDQGEFKDAGDFQTKPPRGAPPTSRTQGRRAARVNQAS